MTQSLVTYQDMTLEQAASMALELAAARKKYGRHASIPRTEDEILQALAVLGENLKDSNLGAKQDLTAANRRHAALNARYQKLHKEHKELQGRMAGLEK